MNTKISRTFEIVDDKGISKTRTILREHGLTINYGKYIGPINGRMDPEKATHALIISLLIAGKIHCKTIVEQLSFDKYFPGWLSFKREQINNKRKAYAVNFANRYHQSVQTLYKSERASVMLQFNEYNESLVYNKDWDAYSKSYGRPAVWKDAAVVILPNNMFDIYTYKGKKVGSFLIPDLKTIEKRSFNHPALEGINQSMFVVQKNKKTVQLFDKNNKLLCLSQQFISPFTYKAYWEHGNTVQEIKDELNRKTNVANKHRQEQAERLDRTMREAIAQNRFYKAKHLIMRIVKNYPVKFEDARAVGYCIAGIKAWCIRAGIEFSETAQVPYYLLKNFNETQRLREAIAERLANHLLNSK